VRDLVKCAAFGAYILWTLWPRIKKGASVETPFSIRSERIA